METSSNFNIEQMLGKPIDVIDDIIENKDQYVRHIEIPKKDGSKRKILAPAKHLKYMQKRINWGILMRYRPSECAHGFVKKRGIVTNATLHVKPKSVGHIDIKNFFDTITVDHLKNCLFGNKNICRFCKNYEGMLSGQCNPSIYKNRTTKFPHGCEELKAVFIPEYCEKTGYQSLFTRIIELCTYKGHTAQGFPTSPYLANIVLKGFDKKMVELANENSCVYSRYADDLTFSSKELTKDELRELFKNKAYRLLWAFGFTANKKKTHWKDVGRFKVCGVVINEKLNIMRKTVRIFRAKVHHAVVKHATQTTKAHIRKLKGWASYLMSVNRDKGKKYMNQLLEFEREKWPAEAA